MPGRIVDLRDQRPLLDIASLGRKSSLSPIRFGRADIEAIRRTVQRVPEVVIKISGGGQTLHQVREHLRYIQRNGKLELETDGGDKLQGRGSHRKLADDWDLDLEVGRPPGQRSGSTRHPRLVHNIVFSMPPGTHPGRLLSAVREFADVEWGGRHRYAMALHTDSSHPHVHVVVKAMSEFGERLNPNPAMLREWRASFAEKLRAQGIAANATDRAIRGAVRPKKRDGRYWAERRGASTRLRDGLFQIASDARPSADQGETVLRATRQRVLAGWSGIAEIFASGGHAAESDEIRRFAHSLPPVRTERQLLAEQWMHHVSIANRERNRSPPSTR